MSCPRLGPGTLPRYGSGWMHSFAAVYALQYELLQLRHEPRTNNKVMRPSPHPYHYHTFANGDDKTNGNNNTNADHHHIGTISMCTNPRLRNAQWFRACELWHTARHEGLALNVAHYNSILRQCVGGRAPWEVCLGVARRMRLEAIRPDVVTIGCLFSSCADHGRWETALALLKAISSSSACRTAAIAAANRENSSGSSSHSSKSKDSRGAGPVLDLHCQRALQRVFVTACRRDPVASTIIQKHVGDDAEAIRSLFLCAALYTASAPSTASSSPTQYRIADPVQELLRMCAKVTEASEERRDQESKKVLLPGQTIADVSEAACDNNIQEERTPEDEKDEDLMVLVARRRRLAQVRRGLIADSHDL